VFIAPTQLNTVEFAKSFHRFWDRKGAIDEWIKNNPKAAEGFKDYYERSIAEGRAHFRFLMKSEDFGESDLIHKLGWANEVAAFIDMLAVAPNLTDRCTRGGFWPVVYDIANRNVALFRTGQISQQKLWNRLSLNTVAQTQSLELQSLLNTGKYDDFMNRYTEYKLENFNGRYTPVLRGIQEVRQSWRSLIGLIVFPRTITNIAIKNGFEPIAKAYHDPSRRNLRGAYDGAMTLIKLVVGSTVADQIFYKVTGRHAYQLADMLTFNLGSPGLGKLTELMNSTSRIIQSNEQKEIAPQITALQVARNASNHLEMFIPLCEVMIRAYEDQNNVDGVKLWTLASHYAKNAWKEQYGQDFKPRNRTWYQKFIHETFGREPPLKLTPEEKALRDYIGAYGNRGDSWYREYKPKED